MIDVKRLKRYTANYWDIQKVRIAVFNRQGELAEDADIVRTLKTLEEGLAKKIKKEVPEHPIWDKWLKHVGGIGLILAAQLICLITGQVHTPECQVKRDAYYSKKKRGEGKRGVREDDKEDYPKGCPYICDCPLVGIERFGSVSSLWKYAGMDVVNGKAPRRKKGEKISWNPRLRALCYNIGKSFVMNIKGPYRKHYDRFKALEQAKNLERSKGLSKGHIDARARRKTVKLFLAHLFDQWYRLPSPGYPDGREPPKPYAFDVKGHSGYIPPPQ